MIIVFTGNGKGKTTASLGQAARAVGRGKNVLMIQFIKGPWKSGEDFVEMKKRDDGKGKFELRKMGLGFVGILGDQLPREKHIEAAEAAFAAFKEELARDAWHLIILDEVNVAASLGLVKIPAVVETLKAVPEERLVLLTGRGAPQEFIDVADLATEMREIKHPFQDGRLAKIMVEF
ncbi:MAG: cob(I)yrinic acid a,c-diamide adenosyltransferase [Patescibacteria group bacterium]